MSVSSSNTEAALRGFINEVMDVETVTLGGDQRETLRAVGRLRQPSHEAFDLLRPRFEQTGHTPFMRREDERDVIVAVNQVFDPDERSPQLNIILFVLTILSTLWVGVQYGLDGPPTMENLLEGLPTGLLFSASMLGILGAHEMGHYLMARRHGVRVTLPYFIPLPTILGTMGAVIAMQEPSPNRRVQFDIGVAGPLAGLVVAIPVLVVGLSLSPVLTESELLEVLPSGATIVVLEGNSLLYAGLKYLMFGKFLPSPAGEDVLLHAVAWAGWAGLLVTALNLIPVGQLDGGHVLYGLLGERASIMRWPVIIALVGLAVLPIPGLGYQGWLLWAFLLYVLARRSAPVLDEITGLDPARRFVAIVMLVIFVLIFVPVPLTTIPLT